LKTSLGKCEICKEAVSALGAYLHLAVGRYAHGQCFRDQEYERGVRDGRLLLLKEQNDAKEQEIKKKEEAAHVFYNALARCNRCGVKISPASPFDLAKFGEVRSESSVRGVCSQCVRDEIQARAVARSSSVATPAQAIQQAPTKLPEPKQEPKPQTDRFSLLDLDD
jgi:hypothetical protein